MSENWELKKLEDICYVLDSKRKPITKNKRIPGDIPYYGASGVVDYIKDYIFDEELLLVSEDGANLLARKYPIAFSVSGKSWVNNHAHVLRFDSRTTQYFVEYYLNSISLENYISGMAQPKLNQKKLNSLPIPLPSIKKQEDIVNFLDKSLELINDAKVNIEKNISNSEELFQSELNQIFNNESEVWENKYLSEICENLDSKRKPITKNKRVSGDVPYYGASGVVDYIKDYIFDEKLLLVSEDGANLLARKYPIAFSISGKTWVNNHAHVLKFESKNTQLFVEYYLNAIKLDDYISGMAQPKLNQTKLNSIPIPYPSAERQDEIISNLTKLSDLQATTIENLEKKLKLLSELKQSILQKAFSGDLLKY